MKKENLTEEQLIFQDAARTFFAREVEPNNEKWEKDGQVSREVWLKAGENNFLALMYLKNMAEWALMTIDTILFLLKKE